MPLPRRLPYIAAALAGCVGPSGDSALGDPGDVVRISGLAYQLRSHAPLEGARISLAEYPDLEAFSGADGRFVLEGVPRSEPVTPTVELADHRAAHHQRFVLEDDLDPLYLQVVPDEIYQALSAILDADGFPVDEGACHVVTTICDPAAATAAAEGWEAFLVQGDAGLIADATAEMSPLHDGAAPASIYFNESVVPDPSLSATTTDGGVLWLNVAPGDYALSASAPDPGLAFPEVEITCAPGRFVNASPPWGLTAYSR